MKAWRIYGEQDLRLEELESPPLGPDSVKLKINCSSISISDRLLYEAKMQPKEFPLIIGRQGVGMVTEVGSDVTSVARGDRIAIDPYTYCKICSQCKSGKVTECEKISIAGLSMDGFLRDFAVVNSDSVCKLPDRVRDNDAIFLEHTALAINAIAKLELEKGEHIVIAGATVTGIIMAQVAMYHQAVPILVDTRMDRLALAEQLGIYYTINSVEEDAQKKIFSLTGGRMAEAMAYLSTASNTLTRSFEYVSKGGRCVIVGRDKEHEDLNCNMLAIASKQLTVYGVNNGAKSFRSAINMIANKTVNVTPIVSKEIEFDKVKDILLEQIEYPNKYMKVIVKI